MLHIAPQYVESFQTSDLTLAPCIGRWIPIHSNTREVHKFVSYFCESISILYVYLICIFLRFQIKVILYSIYFSLSNSFTKHSILQIHPHCCKGQYFTLFNVWIIFNCAYTPHLLHPVICGWPLGAAFQPI